MSKSSHVFERVFRISYNRLACSPIYPQYPFISQQLLTIQEELNTKKSELEQAKEEQSHTQALLKVLQEQVSERSSSRRQSSSSPASGLTPRNVPEVSVQRRELVPCPSSQPHCYVAFLI